MLQKIQKLMWFAGPHAKLKPRNNVKLQCIIFKCSPYG